jgi:glycosyltransferase involved in cell wall biosynthesis
MKVSIVIPVFNEEAVIANTNRRIADLLNVMYAKRLIDDYEIVYVDDGSRDASLSLLREISRASPKHKVISLSRNFGHQSALAAGLIHASGDAVISLDADLQDPPEVIEEMIKKYKEGNDIVYAVRRRRDTDTFFKKWTAKLFYKTMQVMGVDIVYDHADYRLVSGRVLAEFRKVREVNLFLRGIFPYMGFNSSIVYYDRQKRASGETKYPVGKMIAFAWEGITSFSTVPLRLAFFTGLIISISTVLLVLWALFVKMTGRAIPGWTSTVIPLFFIGGLNILFLGLIGEYIGKIYREVKARPIFIIKEMYNFDADQREQ